MPESIIPKACTLAVLVGGRGRRLGGRAKGNLRYAGTTFLERTLALAPLFFEVVLVGDDGGAYPEISARRVVDVASGFGAPAGLVTALSAARTPWVMLFACDMPGASEAAVNALCAAAASDGACFEDADGTLQPFPGLFRTGLGEDLRPRLVGGVSVHGLLRPLALARAPLPRVDHGPTAVANVNTWDDARALGIEPS